MNGRERTLAVLAKQRPDRLPREVKLTPPLLEAFQQRTGSTDPAEYFDLDVRDVYFRPARQNGRFQPVLSRRHAAVVESRRAGKWANGAWASRPAPCGTSSISNTPCAGSRSLRSWKAIRSPI